MPESNMSYYDNPPPPYPVDDSAPSYETLAARFDKAVEVLKGLPPEAQQVAQDAMLKESSSPKTQSDLIDQVKELGQSAMQIDAYFDTVKSALRRIDSDKNIQSKGWKFTPEWVTLQKRWTDLLWESRETATKAEAYIKDFTEVIIPMIEDIESFEDVKECREELADFVQRTEDGGSSRNKPSELAKHLADSFGSLKDDVNAFKEKFRDCSVASDIEDVKQKVDKKREEIDSLEEHLDQYRRINENKYAPILDGMQGCARLLDRFARWTDTNVLALKPMALLFCLAPPVAVCILGAGIGAVLSAGVAGVAITLGADQLLKFRERNIQKYNEQVLAENRELFSQMDALHQQAEALNKLKALMDEQTSTMDGICERLAGFQAIWGAVKHDAEIVNNQLNDVLDSNSRSKKAFKKRMEVIRVNNDNLGKALHQYSITFR